MSSSAIGLDWRQAPTDLSEATGSVACARPVPIAAVAIADQEAVIAYLRQRAATGGRPLFLMTRSSAILDLTAVGSEEAIVLCPANHSPPTCVVPCPGAAGYEAVTTCLTSPEVRARTRGVIAWRPAAA